MAQQAPGKRKIKKILLAEDVEMNQVLTRHFLEARGLEVVVANNGYEALELLDQQSFDCVLMDIQMPEMDGIQTAREIRIFEDPAKAAVPIIALTANMTAGDIEQYRAAGMNDFLAKPFDEASLLEVILRNQPGTDASHPPAPAAKPAPEALLYDLSIVQSVSGGDAAFIKKMILLFFDTVPQNVEELRRAVDTANWDQVGKMAHKLKSTVDSMGIKSLHTDVRTVEANAKQRQQLEAIPGLVQKIATVIDRCIEQLKVRA